MKCTETYVIACKFIKRRIFIIFQTFPWNVQDSLHPKFTSDIININMSIKYNTKGTENNKTSIFT